jgi:hypothetical protein
VVPTKPFGNRKTLALLYLAVITATFIVQSYLLYFRYIPAVLSPFENHPALYDHLKPAFVKMMWYMFFWFSLAFIHGLGFAVVRYWKSK